MRVNMGHSFTLAGEQRPYQPLFGRVSRIEPGSIQAPGNIPPLWGLFPTALAAFHDLRGRSADHPRYECWVNRRSEGG
jgi:hypothetical protein